MNLFDYIPDEPGLVPHIDPKVIIFTGAGLSAESGLATFRDDQQEGAVGHPIGLWNNHPIAEVCNEATWQANYDQVHAFYNDLRQQLGSAQPNNAHQTIARLQQQLGQDVVVITQNVDNLLERAGVSDVLHLHGLLTQMHCTQCDKVWDIGYQSFNPQQACCYCGNQNTIKPNIVFFGGRAPNYQHLQAALSGIYHPDSIVIVSGTQGNVVPIDEHLAQACCTKVLNNLAPSDHINDKTYDQVYFEPASQAWLKIEAYIQQNWLGV